jgi:hypothetical protein
MQMIGVALQEHRRELLCHSGDRGLTLAESISPVRRSSHTCSAKSCTTCPAFTRFDRSLWRHLVRLNRQSPVVSSVRSFGSDRSVCSQGFDAIQRIFQLEITVHCLNVFRPGISSSPRYLVRAIFKPITIALCFLHSVACQSVERQKRNHPVHFLCNHGKQFRSLRAAINACSSSHSRTQGKERASG